MKVFNETLYDAFGQSFRIDKVYFERQTEHQHLMIFHNAALGRVMGAYTYATATRFYSLSSAQIIVV